MLNPGCSVILRSSTLLVSGGGSNKPLPGFAVAFQVRPGLDAVPDFDEEEVSDCELDAVVACLLYLRSREPGAEFGKEHPRR